MSEEMNAVGPAAAVDGVAAPAGSSGPVDEDGDGLEDEPPETTTAPDGEADGGEPSPSPQDRERGPLYQALRSSSPHRPVTEVEGVEDLRSNWRQYGMRALEKMLPGDANTSEAWVDVLRSGAGWVLYGSADGAAGDGDGDGESTGAAAGVDSV